MRTVTANFQTELDKAGGAEPRILLEIDAVGGTLYYSDQTVTVDAQVYSSTVLEFGRLISQIVPGEEVVRVANMNFRLSNITPIDHLIVAGTEVRVYDWYEGLATADKALRFKGNIAGAPGWDDLEISFSANDNFQQLNKIIGRPLLEADWALADPDYYGFTIPILIGAGENLECLPIEAGAASTLREDFEPADTTIKLTSAISPIAFPSSGTVIIGNEEYVYTGISSNDLTGVAPHSDIIYQEGSNVLEKTNLKFLAGESFSDTPVKAITNLRILPFNSKKIAEAVLIDSAFYTINLTETISSKVYATITLTQINAIRKAVSSVITQQQTQANSPSPHGHTPSTVTVSVNLQDTVLISANGPQTRTNWNVVSYLVDDNHNTKGKWLSGFLGSDATVQCKRVALYEENGTPTQLRFNATVTLSGGSGTAKLYINGSLKQTVTLAGGTITSNYYAAVTWGTINASNTYVEIYTTGNAGQYVEIKEVWFDVQYTPANPTTAITVNEVLPAEVGGDTVADTLLGRLIVDFEGYKDKTDGHYTGTPTTQPLIEKPPDVIHFLWEKFSNGAVHADLDISGSFLDARTNLPASYKYGFALIWQGDLAVLSAQLAQMAHCRFFTSAGLAKFSRILDSGTPVKVIDTDDYSPLTEGQEKKIRIRRFGGALEEIINKVEIRYKHNPALGPRDDPDAYASNSESTDAAAAASISTYGERRRRIPWLMWAVRDDTMADDLRDKFLGRNQYPRTTTIFPSWIGLSLLEPSDLIKLTASKLRMEDRLSEILNIGNNSQVPKDFQPAEIMITVRDLGVILIIPDAATCIAVTVNPTVILGSITITPAPATCIATTVNPTVVLGSITGTPAPATCIAATVNPTVIIGVYYNSTRYFDGTKYFNE